MTVGAQPAVLTRRTFAYFRAASGSLSLADLVKLLGVDADEGWSVGEAHPRANQGRPVRTFTSWHLYPPERGGSVSDQLRSLYPRVREIRADAVRAAGGLTLVLEIVQYIHEQDNVNIGIALDAEWVALLADLGAHIDIDQYLE